jgi:hypothetical protein
VLPGATYDEYADRGESENRNKNKELKCGLQADRLSDHRYMAKTEPPSGAVRGNQRLARTLRHHNSISLSDTLTMFEVSSTEIQ